MTQVPGNLRVFELSKGGHGSPQEGVCAMEAVAWLAGEAHTDQPKCTCRIVREMAVLLNDAASDEQRRRLVAYLPRIIGSRGTVQDKVNRGIAAFEHLDTVREYITEHHAHEVNMALTFFSCNPDKIGAEYFTLTLFRGILFRDSPAKISDPCFDRGLELLDIVLNAGPQGRDDYDYEPAVQAYREKILEVA